MVRAYVFSSLTKGNRTKLNVDIMSMIYQVTRNNKIYQIKYRQSDELIVPMILYQ